MVMQVSDVFRCCAYWLGALALLGFLSACSPSGIEVSEEDQTYELTINASSNGSVSASPSGPYRRNQIVTLTATPDANYQVGSWSGTMNDSIATNTNYVRMDADKTVTTNFVPAILLSGTVTYTSIPAVSGAGLNYGAATDLPIRGAIIQIIDQATSVVYSEGNLDASGDYSLSCPSNTAIRILVQAALGTPGDAHTLVVDNTDGASLYTIFLDMTSGASDTTGIDFNADSGWGTSSYTGTRAAGPFAILDVIYTAEQLVLATDSTTTFPQLTVNWSENNVAVSGDVNDGDIGTSHYNPANRAIYILGDDGIDTDEYDISIVAHEWVHYFEDQFSRSDSLGGAHASGDMLDPRVAFSEGLANAISGIINGTNEYIDTDGAAQAGIFLELDLEDSSVDDGLTNNGRTVDGPWSEESVQDVLYDIMDSNDDGSDTISLGFAALYNAMTSDFADTPAFTTIITLLHHMKLQQVASATVIDTLANDESIFADNEFDTTNTTTGLRLYTPVTLGNLVTQDLDAANLTTSDVYETIGSGTNNKLLHHRFFNMTNLAAGTYDITISPTNATELMYLRLTDGSIAFAGANGADLVYQYTHDSLGDFAFSVGTAASAGEFTVQVDAVPGGGT